MNDFLVEYRHECPVISPEMAVVAEQFQILLGVVGQDRKTVRDAIRDLGQSMMKVQGDTGEFHEYDHTVINSMYRRTIFMKKGGMYATKIHTEHNFSFVMQGRARVISEDGDVILQSPDMFITAPGTQRVFIIEEDMVFVTMHPNPTNSVDYEALEDRLSVTTVEDFENRIGYLEVRS